LTGAKQTKLNIIIAHGTTQKPKNHARKLLTCVQTEANEIKAFVNYL